MKLLILICILASAVNSLPYEDLSVWDYFDFPEIARIEPLESSRAGRARSFGSVVSASEKSNVVTLFPPQSTNRRSDSPVIPSERRIGNVGHSIGRSAAPIQPLESLARPVNEKRFTQNVNDVYDARSPSFYQPQVRSQQSYRPHADNNPRLRPSEQYFPEQLYRPEYSRPQPHFRQQYQYVDEPQYRPNAQYRPNPYFKPDSQYVPNYVAQLEEPTYQDSVDYQNFPITYDETPKIKTNKYVFNDQPQYQDEHPQPHQNEQPQNQDEHPRPHQNEPQLYHDEQPQHSKEEQPQYQEEYPQYDELPVYQDYEQEQFKQQEISRTNVESNRDQSQATVNALPFQDKEAQESVVIEKRTVGVHGDLDAAGQAFAENALKVENSKDSGRLAFQIHGQQGPHSYRFGYDTGKGYNRQFRYEERDGNGEVHGRYGFYDESGKLQVTNYSSHPKHGFSADVPQHR